MSELKNIGEWVCTDPDCNQWGRKLSDTIFEFKEHQRGNEEIDLNSYSAEKIESIINSYGYTLHDPKNGNDNIHDLYHENANWIIAECIFETEADYTLD